MRVLLGDVVEVGLDDEHVGLRTRRISATLTPLGLPRSASLAANGGPGGVVVACAAVRYPRPHRRLRRERIPRFIMALRVARPVGLRNRRRCSPVLRHCRCGLGAAGAAGFTAGFAAGLGPPQRAPSTYPKPQPWYRRRSSSRRRRHEATELGHVMYHPLAFEEAHIEHGVLAVDLDGLAHGWPLKTRRCSPGSR